MKKYFLIVVALLMGFNALHADVRLPGIFGDHMVLQRNAPIHIWGWATPGESVRVTLKGKHKQTIADENGWWELNLQKESAGGPYTLEVEGNNKIVLKDVLIGDIWLCSGQSNMEWILKNTDGAKEAIQSANSPQIRHIRIPRKVSDHPEEDLLAEAEWQPAVPEFVENFTAVGYYFAKQLQTELNVPIGLVNSSWGGTHVETWISRAAFENTEDFKEMIDAVPLALQDSILKKGPNTAPTLLSNSMIEPLVPFKIKGVIWYQGESNAGLAHEYRKTFPLLIKDWRNRWDIGDFPFYFVQLAAFKASGGTSEKGSTWAELREAQAMTLSLKNTGMAVTADIGDVNDIHPRNKKDVGQRLAAIALNKTYKKRVSYSGPVYKKMKKNGDAIKVYFDHLNGGLQTKEPGSSLKGFEIAGADRTFKPAEARIEGDYVVVSSSEVSDPVAVRYGWADNNININLFNRANLPAAPFRTDQWDGVTVGKKRAFSLADKGK